MRPEMWKRLLWQVLGTLCYLAGMFVFLLVAVDVFTGSSSEPLAGFSTRQLVLLCASIVLVVAGGLVSRYKGGGFTNWRGDSAAYPAQGRDQSVLEEYGYVTPADTADDQPKYEYDDEGGVVYVYCPKCNERNERGFTYCRNCSAELSG